MNSIIEKPYSFSLSITFLILGIFLILKTELFLSGVFFLIGSLFIFNSFAKSDIRQFKIGQILIYIGGGVFYFYIVSGLVIGVHILFFMSLVMFHINFNYILDSEYE